MTLIKIFCCFASVESINHRTMKNFESYRVEFSRRVLQQNLVGWASGALKQHISTYFPDIENPQSFIDRLQFEGCLRVEVKTGTASNNVNWYYPTEKLHERFVIEFEEMPTFETIQSYFTDTNTDGVMKEFSFRGRRILAQRKFTYRGKVVNTSYLHIWTQIGLSKNTMSHWREQKDGSFKTI